MALLFVEYRAYERVTTTVLSDVMGVQTSVFPSHSQVTVFLGQSGAKLMENVNTFNFTQMLMHFRNRAIVKFKFLGTNYFHWLGIPNIKSTEIGTKIKLSNTLKHYNKVRQEKV